MIVTEFYKGQGLGNQLACYITTRVIAKDKGYDFGIMHPENFKGADFFDLDFGNKVIGGKGPEGGPPEELPEGITFYYIERKITHPISGADIRLYDKNLVDVLDNTKIDGIMQDEQYFLHRKDEIREWLKVKEKYEYYNYSDNNTCVINFRGGEYTRHDDFFLDKEYWTNAVNNMLKINKNFRFIVITDDTHTAKKFFPNYDVFHFSIAKDYVVIKNAKYLILSNSSFAWFPAWLNKDLKLCITPKYWGRYNISDGYWSCGYNITQGWMYQDRNGNLSDYDSCLKELNEYIKNHEEYFTPTKVTSNFLVVSNYNNDIRWVPEYTDNYIIYDRSDKTKIPETINPNKIIKTKNLGYNLFDYFSFIIENYENLPECTIFSKGNILPRHVTKEYLDRIINNGFFTPIEDYKTYNTYWPVCFIASDGGFCEINNSWYMRHHPIKYFKKYDDFMEFFFKNPPIPKYIRFAPGGNYIVPKENILKLPKIFYENFKTIISHCSLPGEAHLLERALHTLWTCNFELNPEAFQPIDKKILMLRKKTFKTLLKEKTPLKIKNIIKFLINETKNTINYIRQPFDILKEKNREKIWISKVEILNYKKNIKVYDVFSFFNELDLLEIRLNILNDYVDYFVIIESTESFSGLPHTLCYKENEERFAQWKDKIIYYVVDDFPKDTALLTLAQNNSNVGAGEHYWVREFYQKESAKKALTHLSDNDVVFISDCDEIWNPLRLKELTDFSKTEINRPKQLAYYYYLNNRCSEINGWTGTVVTQYKNIANNCLNDLRTRSKTKYKEIDSGGWHFGFMGGVDGAMKKLKEWQHPEYMNWIPTLKERVEKNKDYRGRKYKYWIDESDLPEYIVKNKNKYKELFKMKTPENKKYFKPKKYIDFIVRKFRWLFSNLEGYGERVEIKSLNYFLLGQNEKCHLERYQFSLSVIKKEDIVGDFACGTGYGSVILSKKAKKVVGVDLDGKVIKKTKERYKEIKNVEFSEANLLNINYENIFNFIISFETIEHFEEPDIIKLLNLFNKSLIQGGRIMFSTPYKQENDEQAKKMGFHKTFMIDEEKIKEWLTKTNFNFESFQYQNYNSPEIKDCLDKKDFIIVIAKKKND